MIERKKIETWFVTGASSGIGKEVCHQLLQRGYNVIAVSRRVPDITNKYCLCLSVDVTKKEQVEHAMLLGIAKFGKIDVLMNNAGMSSNRTLEEESEEQMRQVFEVNFWGAYNMMRALLPHFRENKNGTIINNTSQSAIAVRAYGSAYCSSKHALEGLSATIWHEAQRFCRVMAVELGYFRGTEVTKGFSKEVTKIEDYKKIPSFYKKYAQDFTNHLPSAVSAIIDTIEHDPLPRRLMLGKDALIRIKKETDDILHDLELSKEKALFCSKPKNIIK